MNCRAATGYCEKSSSAVAAFVGDPEQGGFGAQALEGGEVGFTFSKAIVVLEAGNHFLQLIGAGRKEDETVKEEKEVQVFWGEQGLQDLEFISALVAVELDSVKFFLKIPIR